MTTHLADNFYVGSCLKLKFRAIRETSIEVKNTSSILGSWVSCTEARRPPPAKQGNSTHGMARVMEHPGWWMAKNPVQHSLGFRVGPGPESQLFSFLGEPLGLIFSNVRYSFLRTHDDSYSNIHFYQQYMRA